MEGHLVLDDHGHHSSTAQRVMICLPRSPGPYASVVLEDQFPTIPVSAWEVDSEEAAGLGEKIWLLQPDSKPKRTWLFKPAPVVNGFVVGEDWAEKAAAHLAKLLYVPCADVELAEYQGRRGTISASLRPKSQDLPNHHTHDLHHGQEFMQARGVVGYIPGYAAGRPGHSLENIRDVLAGGFPPPGCDLPFEATAFDVFAGYMVLDAWIANRDRHDENWAVLLPRTGDEPLRLCGAYDQANSLGYNVPDDKRQRLLTRQGVEAWCERGTAHRFEHVPGEPIPTLVQLAAKALRLASRDAREYWPQQLSQLKAEDWVRVISQLPRMSDPARSFALSVLEVNRRRVLDACM